MEHLSLIPTQVAWTLHQHTSSLYILWYCLQGMLYHITPNTCSSLTSSVYFSNVLCVTSIHLCLIFAAILHHSVSVQSRSFRKAGPLDLSQWWYPFSFLLFSNSPLSLFLLLLFFFSSFLLLLLLLLLLLFFYSSSSSLLLVLADLNLIFVNLLTNSRYICREQKAVQHQISRITLLRGGCICSSIQSMLWVSGILFFFFLLCSPIHFSFLLCFTFKTL